MQEEGKHMTYILTYQTKDNEQVTISPRNLVELNNAIDDCRRLNLQILDIRTIRREDE